MIYHFGPYQLDAHRGELRCASRPVEIEPKVFDVLVYLIEHRDRIVTNEDRSQCLSDRSSISSRDHH